MKTSHLNDFMKEIIVPIFKVLDITLMVSGGFTIHSGENIGYVIFMLGAISFFCFELSQSNRSVKK